ncbi:hypothetical protein NM688_g7601 [Phlebia brevispora]|uniref:Uncharacterized protein n=1 Tax=Phlebia brevispora TaxID=194682 RepID=A0ACC1S3G4_9APHY|nr:hypothetical protein NM688_g7601 [Phlebia brevispora]
MALHRSSSATFSANSSSSMCAVLPSNNTRHRLLDLNDDVLDLILGYLPVEDARKFRLCARRASVVAEREAHRSLTLNVGYSIDVARKFNALYSGKDYRFPWLREVTVREASRSAIEQYHEEAAKVLLEVLSKAHNLRKLTCCGLYKLLEVKPELSNKIKTLDSLDTLIFEGPDLWPSPFIPSFRALSDTSGANNETLNLRSLSALTLTRLNADNIPVASKLNSLERLVVGELSGDLSRLVDFAPNLVSLEVAHVLLSNVVITPEHGWKALNRIEGTPVAIHRLLPLIHCRVHHVIFRLDLRGGMAPRLSREVVEHVSPCHLSIRGQPKPNSEASFYEELSHAPPSLFCLELEAPNDDRPFARWMMQLPSLLKNFSSLLCLNLHANCFLEFARQRSMSGTSNEPVDTVSKMAHYVGWKVPSLQFLLCGYTGSRKDQLGLAFGYRLPRRESARSYATWMLGRALRPLSRAAAEQVRLKLRDASTYDSALRIADQLFPVETIAP